MSDESDVDDPNIDEDDPSVLSRVRLGPLDTGLIVYNLPDGGVRFKTLVKHGNETNAAKVIVALHIALGDDSIFAMIMTAVNAKLETETKDEGSTPPATPPEGFQN